MSEIIECPIHTPHIELAQVLKLAALVGTGGEAKHVIQSGFVSVNGEVNTRRSSKLKAGDIVHFDAYEIHIKGESD